MREWESPGSLALCSWRRGLLLHGWAGGAPSLRAGQSRVTEGYCSGLTVTISGGPRLTTGPQNPL